MDVKDDRPQQLADELLDEMGTETFNQIAKVAGLIAEEGLPVPVTEAAKTLRMSLEEARAFLVRTGAEFDEKKNLVGLGITLVPTPHSFEVKGKELFTWCAGDTLIFPMTLGQTANVRSLDPVSGARIKLIASPHGVESIEPSTSVLTWPNSPDSDRIRESVCNVTHFFASRETAEKYASSKRNVTILTPKEVHEIFEIIGKKTEILTQQK